MQAHTLCFLGNKSLSLHLSVGWIRHAHIRTTQPSQAEPILDTCGCFGSHYNLLTHLVKCLEIHLIYRDCQLNQFEPENRPRILFVLETFFTQYSFCHGSVILAREVRNKMQTHRQSWELFWQGYTLEQTSVTEPQLILYVRAVKCYTLYMSHVLWMIRLYYSSICAMAFVYVRKKKFFSFNAPRYSTWKL